MPEFIPGLVLARGFFEELVQPILKTHFSDLRYAAALMGSGSEVLGYDTAMSTDHHWGPRVILFLSVADKANYGEAIKTLLSQTLPYQFRGYSTHYGEPIMGEGDHGTQLLTEIKAGVVNHRVQVSTLRELTTDILGFDLDQDLTPADWLTFPQQKLLSITAGAVFHDDIGLAAVRDRFAYYPREVWLYLLLAGWSRIGQDEHLAPRAGFVGDELGSSVIAGRLVRSIMELCFLMEKTYAPYPKWFGTAFSRLTCGAPLTPILRRVQTGENWQQREAALVEAYKTLNQMHNGLGITSSVQPAVALFHERPFLVTNAWRYMERILAEIQDEGVKAIAQKTYIGGIDQFSDNTDMREDVHLRDALISLYKT